MSANTIESFVERNPEDLQALGLLLCRLLRADLCTMDHRPSAVFATAMSLSEGGALGTNKPLMELIGELGDTGEPLLTDPFGVSLLRL